MSNTPPESQWHPLPLVIGTLFALILFASWLWDPTRSLWQALDDRAFWAMNRSLAEGAVWQQFWAVTNNRAFDLAAAVAMIGLFAHYALLRDRRNLRRHIATGLIMVLTLLISVQVGKALPIERPSATMEYPDALRLSTLVPDIDTKDYSSDSFPGDHGLVLLVCAGFIARFMPPVYGLIGMLFVVVFTMPRLMSGAHWLTDEIVGALSLGTLALCWMLATPLEQRLRHPLESWLRRRGL